MNTHGEGEERANGVLIKVKICGITNSKDASAAIGAGASYLGLIFAESSLRRIQVQIAQSIAKEVAGTCPLVGVFQDAPLSEVKRLIEETPLDLVQLHGRESAQYCLQFAVPVIKVFSLDFLNVTNLPLLLRDYAGCCDFVMLDKPKNFIDPDWLNRAVKAIGEVEHQLPPYFFAGGLSSLNLSLVLGRLHPYCLDVTSGVESVAGRKDIKAIRDFFDVVNGRSVISQELEGS